MVGAAVNRRRPTPEARAEAQPEEHAFESRAERMAGGPVRVGPRLGPVGWARWAVRQLTSMRTALILLLLLAVAAIPGSLLPQRGADPLDVTRYLEENPTVGPVLDRLGLFDVFASAWFSAIYLLLFLSLIGCLLPRTVAHARAMRAPIPPAPRRMDRLAHATSWSTTDPGALDSAIALLRAERWRVTPGTAGAAGSVAAEKGMLRETGNLLFHVALLGVLVGVGLGGLLGWKGTVIVREGSGFANTLTQYDSFSPARLASADSLPPFSFTLDDFDATFEREGSQRGAPRSFQALLSYRAQPGAPVEQRSVSVNAPLRVDGAKVFLVGHGYAPHLRLTDSTGRVVLDDTVVFLPQDGAFTSTGVVKAPDADPPIGIQGLLAPTARLDPTLGPISTFPAPDDPGLFVSAWTGDLGLDSGIPSNVFQLDVTGLERIGLEALRPGDTWPMPDGAGTLEFVGLERWASFTIAHDPGKPLALGAALLAILGLSLSLFVRRRRVWVRVTPVPVADRGASLSPTWRVEVGAHGRSDSADLSAEVEALVARMGRPEGEEEPS